VLEPITIPTAGVDCTVTLYVFSVYCATASVVAVIVNVMDFCPEGWPVPFTVHSVKA